MVQVNTNKLDKAEKLCNFNVLCRHFFDTENTQEGSSLAELVSSVHTVLFSWILMQLLIQTYLLLATFPQYGPSKYRLTWRSRKTLKNSAISMCCVDTFLVETTH